MRLVPVTLQLRASDAEVLAWHVRQHHPGISVAQFLEELATETAERIIRDHHVEEQPRRNGAG
jgi:hypothetical protein